MHQESTVGVIVEHLFRWWRGWRLGLPSSVGSQLADGAAPPNHWPMPPRRESCTCWHSFGPDHLRLMSVDGQGKLTARPERYTANTQDKTDRVPTMAVLSPDWNVLLVDTTFDVAPVRAGAPDGSPILWVSEPDDLPSTVRGFMGGKYKVIASNAPDPDGLAVFPLRDDGTLGTAMFHDAKSGSPFYIAFLNRRPDTFVLGYAVADGCAIATIDGDGKI
jgi:hypothetical protein